MAFHRVIEDAPTWLAIQQTWRISTSHKQLTGVIDPRRAGLVLLLARGPSTIHACATGCSKMAMHSMIFPFFSCCCCESATQFPEILNVITKKTIQHQRESYTHAILIRSLLGPTRPSMVYIHSPQ